uniref:Adaptin_N domain-containing protein n=1 Tax=Gongylonema pulchrum TaxID=637853 RepID=A0A183ENW2_9BILA
LLALFEFAISRGLRMDQYIQRISSMAEECLGSNDHNSRVVAIKYFVTAFLKDKEECSDEDFLLLEELLSDAAEDRDSRVRIAALRGLSELAANGRLLSFHIYLQVKNVRFFEVTGRNDAKLRLVDDAFATVCHAINDVEVSVRAVAARLLGDFQQVSDSFLDQTLDKKLLNAMRMSKTRESASKRPQKHGSRHQRSQASSEWSTGRRLGEDVPVERFDEEQSSIISSGACGAFVTALEDEFMS